MLVYDPKAEIITKIREQSILDIQHYPRFEDQQNAIIRITYERLLERLEEIERRQFGDPLNENQIKECVNEFTKIAAEVFVDVVVVLSPSFDIEGELMDMVTNFLSKNNHRILR